MWFSLKRRKLDEARNHVVVATRCSFGNGNDKARRCRVTFGEAPQEWKANKQAQRTRKKIDNASHVLHVSRRRFKTNCKIHSFALLLCVISLRCSFRQRSAETSWPKKSLKQWWSFKLQRSWWVTATEMFQFWVKQQFSMSKVIPFARRLFPFPNRSYKSLRNEIFNKRQTRKDFTTNSSRQPHQENAVECSHYN